MLNKKSEKIIYIKKRHSSAHKEFHGGSWKLAYADFVTALMAFFLLLWLLNASPNKKLEGVAKYFMPTLSFLKDKEEQKQTNNKIGIQYGVERVGAIVDIKAKGVKINVNEINNKIFAKIESNIDQANEKNSSVSQSLSYKDTPIGLEITVHDQENHPLFKAGGYELSDFAKMILTKVSEFISMSPNLIRISGYTDKSNVTSISANGNWELSAHRANAARKYLLIQGITSDRISELVAKADTDLLDPENPYSPKNRRITITLLRNSNPAFYKISTPKDLS
ncbi:MAG: chemotaxis protein MotB [Candidatus Midichloriaceae bacterium]|jgi:chemotaxis protein MotB